MANFRFFNTATSSTILGATLDDILITAKGSVLVGSSNGIESKTATDSVVKVTVDGSVIAGFTGIRLDGRDAGGIGANHVTVSETGFVQGLSGMAVYVSGKQSSIVNDGVLESGANCARLEGDDGRFVNSGHISAQQEAVHLSGGRTWFGNTGTIDGGEDGVFSSGANLIFSNSGTIRSDGTKVSFASSSGAELTGTAMTISNGGLIEGNTGLKVGGASALIANSGRIEGVEEALTLQGDDAVIWNSGVVISSAAAGLKISGKNWHVNNSGQIDSLNDDGVSFSGAAATTFKGFLRNSGTIEAGAVAVDLNFTETTGNPGSTWFLHNSGHILGGNGGIFTNVLPVILFNSGTISTAVGIAVSTSGQSLITNRGTIEGGAAAIGPIMALKLGAGVDQLKNFGDIHGDVLTGAGADVVRNGGFIDGTLDLGDGNDSYDGRGGLVDVIVLGGGRNDVLKGGAQDDTMSGDGGDDRLFGRAGDDSLTGGLGNDAIRGGAGDDTIEGGTGADTLNGGAGEDVLTGGAGADSFEFQTVTAISIGTAFDRITDFQSGVDRIDLSAIGGLSFDGDGNFARLPGQLIYVSATGQLQGDLDGDNLADFTLLLANHPDLTPADLVL